MEINPVVVLVGPVDVFSIAELCHQKRSSVPATKNGRTCPSHQSIEAMHSACSCFVVVFSFLALSIPIFFTVALPTQLPIAHSDLGHDTLAYSDAVVAIG